MTNKSKVLVIDDDEVFCQLIKRGLERHDYVVQTAHSESDALGIAKSFLPDHVLLDLRLGDTSGLQLIKPLLNIKSDTHIVVLTGYASLATAVQAIKLGAINYLAKPVDVATVLKSIMNPNPSESPAELEEQLANPTSLKRLEWEHIQRVLHENDGNISATARQLNMHRRTLQRKLQKKPSE